MDSDDDKYLMKGLKFENSRWILKPGEKESCTTIVEY